MATDQVLVNLSQTKTVPLDYVVPGSLEIALQSVTSTFDGSASLSSYLPALQIIGPGGVIAATFVDKDNAVSAGESAEVTFGTFLRKPGGATAPCNPTQIIVETIGADAYWPLDETSGNVAHDQSGNGHDLGVTTTAPTWAFSLSPPGTASPLIAAGQSFGDTGAAHTYSPNLSGDFTVVAWYITNGPQSGSVDNLCSQGNVSVDHTGFLLGVEGVSVGAGKRLIARLGTGGGVFAIEGDTAVTYGSYFMGALRRQSGTFSLNLNGVTQTTTYSGAFVAHTTNFVINHGSLNTTQEAWVQLYTKALSDGELALLFAAA